MRVQVPWLCSSHALDHWTHTKARSLNSLQTCAHISWLGGSHAIEFGSLNSPQIWIPTSLNYVTLVHQIKAFSLTKDVPTSPQRSNQYCSNLQILDLRFLNTNITQLWGYYPSGGLTRWGHHPRHHPTSAGNQGGNTHEVKGVKPDLKVIQRVKMWHQQT